MKSGKVMEISTGILTVGWVNGDHKLEDHPEFPWTWDKKRGLGFKFEAKEHEDCQKDKTSPCLFDYVQDYVDAYDLIDVFESWEQWWTQAKESLYHCDDNGACTAEIEVKVVLTVEWEYDYWGEYDEYFWYENITDMPEKEKP